ncbi:MULTISPECIES: hypothetical protein [unclassified Caballeronia]|uniref:hypothetical protein n=1 Tax=unclassified Caballeronia TaxID=2646786 RepID=UPI00286644FA|nr:MULTISPECIES: hypothetical protein [unclassified Caballeronia]MDR5776269.1 hypothetical protein [Caballeronia sp. LZ002]MDR5851709.1 hypothetical protein [Caballeronia sp. LZ003]
MNLRCKPGDLAYVVSSEFQQNIGAVVEVVEAAGMIEGMWAWHFESSRPLVGLIPGCPRIISAKDGTIADECLRPISGVPIEEETPVSVNLPEAFKLVLGIEMRDWA